MLIVNRNSKNLYWEWLDVEISNNRKGYDRIENTLAAREVVLWGIQRPEESAN